MSFYPELDRLSLAELVDRWNDELPQAYEDANLYYDELANLSVGKGKAGRDYLGDYLASAMSHELGSARLGAALCFVPSPEDALPLGELLQYLHSSDAHVVSRTVWGLTQQREKDAIEEVLLLKSHPFPQVRGSVLEFLSKLYPELAKPFLLEALHDSSHIVRASAIDELDYLEAVESVADIKWLLTDSHPFVRQAAQTAVENLER
jgi:HEAT repeat protein